MTTPRNGSQPRRAQEKPSEALPEGVTVTYSLELTEEELIFMLILTRNAKVEEAKLKITNGRVQQKVEKLAEPLVAAAQAAQQQG